MRLKRLITLISPFQIISLGVFIAALALLAAIELSLQTPRLGLEFSIGEDDSGKPVAAALSEKQAGRTVIVRGLSVAGDETVESISAFDLIEEPDILGAAEYNRFMQRQGALHRLLQAPALELHLADGERLPIEPRVASIADLPSLFWLQVFYCLSALLIAVSLWAFRREQREVVLLMLTAAGYALGGAPAAIYSTRELAMSGDMFFALNIISHLGVYLFIGFLLSLLCIYPVRLYPRRFIPRVVTMVAVSAWILSVLQWLDFYVTFIAMFAVVLWLLGQQWRQSARSPLERAAMQWFLMSIGLSTGFFFTLVMLPSALGHAPLVGSQGSMLVFIWLMFIGITLGVARYRLFDLGRWWFLAWLWFLGGASVVVLDMALLYLWSVPQSTALPLALVAVAWLYFPFRQWLWQRFRGRRADTPEDYLPMIIEAFLGNPGDEAMRQSWSELLRRAFAPLQLTVDTRRIERAAIVDNGLRLHVPGIDGQGRICLAYADQGARLFSEQDRKLAQSLGALVERSWAVAHARREGEHLERERIKRELHDGLGAKLQAMMHGRQGHNDLAPLVRVAWLELRDILSALDGEDRLLSEISGLWRSDIKRLLADRQLELDWSVDLQDEIRLPALMVLHLGRIISEVSHNAVRHASPSRIKVAIRQNVWRLTIQMLNDGVSGDSNDWVMGRGMHNIRHRASELGGEASWTATTPGEVEFLLDVPLRA